MRSASTQPSWCECMLKELELWCPACCGALRRHSQSYECLNCGLEFPVIAGIPDFRLKSDRYLSLEEERAKAEALHKAGETRSFAQLLQYYYEITGDVTPTSATRFAQYAMDGQRRAGLALDDFGFVGPASRLLDVGCGSAGGLLAANGRFSSAVGLDIALRWLVIGRKRLEEKRLSAQLICADISNPPFKPGQFSHVLALDVIDHIDGLEPALASLRGQLRQHGRLWLSATNKRWLGPHPSSRVWAAAYRSAASRRVRSVSGDYDPLRFVSWRTPGQVRQSCEAAGLDVLDVRPSRISAARGRQALWARGYNLMRRSRVLNRLLVFMGPFFQLTARRR